MTKAERYYQLMSERSELFRSFENLRIIVDRDTIEEFEKISNQSIGVIYESRYSILLVDLVVDSKGRMFCYERIIPTERGKAVVIIPLYQNRFVLLKQFRHSIRDFQNAFPRGYGEEKLSGEENARKEIMEELGANVISCKKIGTVIADSGLSGNEVDILLCEIDNIRIKKGYEGIENYLLLEEHELLKMISNCEINDGYTLSSMAIYNSLKKEENTNA